MGLSEGPVVAAAEVRSEYASARVIGLNLEHRRAGTRLARHPGYVPPEIDYRTSADETLTIRIRDADVRFLDRVPPQAAAGHVGLIHRARRGDLDAATRLDERSEDTRRRIAARFAGPSLVEDEFVVPYTSAGAFSEEQISHKGGILLDLSRRGFATADFCLLSAATYRLPAAERERHLDDAVRNLEILSGRRLGDPANPLLVAVRSALPEYVPGFMPTFLNAGLTPEVLPGLPRRYGEWGASLIRLNSRKTLLEALDGEAFRAFDARLRPGLEAEACDALSTRMEAIIEASAPGLLRDARAQVAFLVSRAYRFFAEHTGVLRNFMHRETHYPAVILQRMVCSVLDERSYAGVLYSRHPHLGRGPFLQFGRRIFGEDLMTGRLPAEERHFEARDEARADFPAVYHFWERLAGLEAIFRGPVMVEFTGVHGTFTVLQVNAAELSGAGMLTAVMDLHRAGRIPAERVRELIQPYHVRQIESDAIDPRSLHGLEAFGRGVAVLPRSAVTGRLVFSAERAADLAGAHAVLVKERFAPQDAIEMQRVGGICSLSPAAIHVVTTAQNLGIPALLNLEEGGLRIEAEARRLINRQGRELKEGDWVTVSSRFRTLYAGRASFAPARLLRFMEGEDVPLTAEERVRFERLAEDYREYRRILESVDASEFASLQDLGHAIRYGELCHDTVRAAEFVNRAFDLRTTSLVRRLFDATLGMHLINRTAYERLTPDRRQRLLRLAGREARERGASGYQAGAFVIGSFVDPDWDPAFWEAFEAPEVAWLIDEWVLHQKYLAILDEVGEARISRAKNAILSRGLSALPIPGRAASDFLSLKLSRVSLEEVRAAVPDSADPQTGELIDLLRRPYGVIIDFSSPSDRLRLGRLCAEAGRPLPGPDDV